MDTQAKAKKAAIITMMHGFPSSQDRITVETINAYLAAVEKCSLDAVQRACTQYLTGRVDGHNAAYVPTAAELSSKARQWDEAIGAVTASQKLRELERVEVYKIGEQPPPPLKPLGPTKLEIDGIMRDTSDWTHEEKEIAMKTGHMPDSRDPSKLRAPTPRIKRVE